MLRRIRDVWKMLGSSIYEGERYERSTRNLGIMGVAFCILWMLSAVRNMIGGQWMVGIFFVVYAGANAMIAYFALKKKDRKNAVRLIVPSVMCFCVYVILFGENGSIALWIVLLPLATCYLCSVKIGLFCNMAIAVLFVVLCWTPLRSFAEQRFPPALINRIPAFYILLTITVFMIMAGYHRSVLERNQYEKDLRDARDAAEKANSAKSDFLANMSHEIRTPINAIMGINTMLMRECRQLRKTHPEIGGDMEKLISLSGNIDGAGNNLLSIINDILDFSRIEAGKVELTNAEYKLSALISSVSVMLSFRAKEKGLAFRVKVDPQLPERLRGDEVRLRQVILNLLANAVKYTEKGSVDLIVSREDSGQLQEGGEIRLAISVQDTGIGIKEEDLAQIFTKFERADLPHNRSVEGTGLGLTIVQNLVRQMNGTIRVDSRYGEGSVFTVVVPQQTASCEVVGDYQARYEQNIMEEENQQALFRAPSARILAVDDSRLNLTVIAGLLKDTDAELSMAVSGTEALALAEQHPYDLILMDQLMPGMDGTETLHRIREQKNGKNTMTPVVCLTADAISGAKERYIAEGFTDYLAKPVDSRTLESILMKYLPAEKLAVGEATRAGKGSEHTLSAAETAALLKAGIRPKDGMKYCQDSAELYRTLLCEYIRDAEKKIPALEKALAGEDWECYRINVHSLKSNSRTVGAADLAETAAQLEAVARDKDAETIRESHASMIERYRKITGILEPVFAGNETAANNGILEFMPEDA